MSECETYVRLFYKGMSLLVPMSFILNAHPGGAEYILQYANQDITAAFEDMNHSTKAVALLMTFEETEKDRDCEVYEADKHKRASKASHSFDEEHRRLSELRWWRRRNYAVTVATTLTAVGAVVFALRRRSVQHS